MTKAEEMRALARSRMETYAVLSALYSAPPSNALVESIRKGTVGEELGCDPAGDAGRELASITGKAGAMERLDIDLTAEHTRLFTLPGALRPYESFFLDKKGRIGGRITLGVRRFYECAGVELTPACLDLADHIGVELEFMKSLCSLEEQLWEKPESGGLGRRAGSASRAGSGQDGRPGRCVEIEQEFLKEHLLQWYKLLCDRILAEASPGFYRALAHLTRDFLGEEREYVAELCEKVRVHVERVGAGLPAPQMGRQGGPYAASERVGQELRKGAQT